jgi:phosphomannomutase
MVELYPITAFTSIVLVIDTEHPRAYNIIKVFWVLGQPLQKDFELSIYGGDLTETLENKTIDVEYP